MRKKNMEKIVKSAIAGVLALTTVSSIITSSNVSAAEQQAEKCFGIAKAGMNDCETAAASCAGSAKKDSQPDAYLFVPQGLCNKIVGGNIKPNKKSE